ncbi:hypothetical protein CVH13_01257, partial [Dehalococcoides mccartyi]
HTNENRGISDDDEKWLKENINDFFKKDHNQNEHGSEKNPGEVPDYILAG